MVERSVPDAGQPGSGAAPVPEGVLVFGDDGTLIAASAGHSAHPPVASLADLETRYRQSDGMPIDLRRRGRYVGIPVGWPGPRVLLVSEPLTPLEATGERLAVTVIPFRDEEDPQTLQRALGSVLAHELRTPMTTVYAGADLLAKPGLAETSRTEAARSLANAAEQLHQVIEDLVLLVRWSTDAVDEPEPVLLQPLLRAAAKESGSEDVRVDLAVPVDLPPVLGSQAFVEHLVRNVIRHAVANTPRGGRVGVVVREDGDWVELTVSDEGPLRADAERLHAFDLFAPTSRQRTDPSGANLALVAARRLVERLGGRIRAGQPTSGGQSIVHLRAAREP